MRDRKKKEEKTAKREQEKKKKVTEAQEGKGERRRLEPNDKIGEKENKIGIKGINNVKGQRIGRKKGTCT